MASRDRPGPSDSITITGDLTPRSVRFAHRLENSLGALSDELAGLDHEEAAAELERFRKLQIEVAGFAAKLDFFVHYIDFQREALGGIPDWNVDSPLFTGDYEKGQGIFEWYFRMLEHENGPDGIRYVKASVRTVLTKMGRFVFSLEAFDSEGRQATAQQQESMLRMRHLLYFFSADGRISDETREGFVQGVFFGNPIFRFDLKTVQAFWAGLEFATIVQLVDGKPHLTPEWQERRRTARSRGFLL